MIGDSLESEKFPRAKKCNLRVGDVEEIAESGWGKHLCSVSESCRVRSEPRRQRVFVNVSEERFITSVGQFDKTENIIQ